MPTQDITQQNSLQQLRSCGQSYWLDNLTRDMIRDGELKRRVVEEGLGGVTSNPSTFQKALTGSQAYDDQVRSLAADNRSDREIFEAVMVEDVQQACDILLPVYQETARLDGYVSLEVSPHHAHDASRTMGEARRLHGLVNRPNLMIKVPGTSACVPAIETLLYEGLNINITLLFSIEHYQAVAEAYLRALERRVGEGKPVDGLASVASFFVSRVDTLADQLLAHRSDPERPDDSTGLPQQLMGRIAVANARVAYKYFKQIFAGERWEKLARHGARPQRVLWASTGRKNPAYSDVGYIEPLGRPRHGEYDAGGHDSCVCRSWAGGDRCGGSRRR
ncbi:MAG: transaldolase [Nitrospira sp.]